MAKASNKSATRIDKAIGEKIRKHRVSKGLTQTQLGTKLGVTFPQIQKYENGTNRVGCGRLYQIAEILEVPVTVFFKVEKPSTIRPSSPFCLLDDPVSQLMLTEFSRIRSKKMRRLVMELVEQLVATGKR